MPNTSIGEIHEVPTLQQPVPPVVGSLSSLQAVTEQFCEGVLQIANILSQKAIKINDWNLKTNFLSVSGNLREISSALVLFFGNNSMTANRIESILDDEDGLDDRFNGMIGEIRDLSKRLGVVADNIRLVSDSLRQILDALQEDEVMAEAGLEIDEVFGEVVYTKQEPPTT
ncbi:hypothetical protein HNY73_009413 [Argiope bruennichi]|uniref:Uncharacterized protein n=1 Tax=Argiope bruennichi TaxID=94029 RepID=A0A8T0F9F8_ARGBR|nr:hypothetical protein HNY73_009413 [Argiope bruennichi]